MATGSFMLTYAPAPASDGTTPGPEDLARLVEVAAGIQRMQDVGPLYERVDVDNGMVRFVIRFDRLPEVGAANVARGLAGRAVSDAKLTGGLVEVECTQVESNR